MVYGLYCRCSIPGRGEKFFCTPQRLDRICGPPSFLPSEYRALFPGVKQVGHEADRSTPSVAVDHSLMRLHGVYLFSIGDGVRAIIIITSRHSHIATLMNYPNIVRAIKSRTMRWAGRVARIGNEKCVQYFGWIIWKRLLGRYSRWELWQ
jgi:hypothetical protein